ncbi:SpoIIIE family cell division protein [Staphylococcus aureus]|uniref:SpoIIIE family cell division protein n=1 Tax=Staphylococcus aureus TaxID=1280 RepID=A0A380EKK7_STAAU|nr:SpoIIIE family cell division protein [Staphylococcus aureus]
MSVAYENENVEQSADTISDEKEQYHRDYRKQSPRFSFTKTTSP